MSDATPKQVTTVYATDEDILIHAGADYSLLVPAWQQMAAGADGAFANGSPWVLTSATVDFEANGVKPNHVVQLTAPKGVYGSAGHFLAVNDVSGGSITLRRPYKALDVGQPPAPSTGLTAVGFTISTFDPQIAEASYDLQQRFSIDDNTTAVGIQRSSAWVYDLQVLRVATVYTVLLELYTLNARTNKGDFDLKVTRFQQKLADAIGRVTVRWGPCGASQESTTVFSSRLCR